MAQLSLFIIAHWELWLALVILLVLIMLNEVVLQKKQPKSLSPAAAVRAINDEQAIIIDLRDETTYREGHIIDAVRASADEFETARMDKYKSQPLILVCARGLQSPALATKLRAQGFTHTMVLAGGIAAWQASNMPVVKGNKKS